MARHKGQYCDRHSSKETRIKIQAEQDRLVAEAPKERATSFTLPAEWG